MGFSVRGNESIEKKFLGAVSKKSRFCLIVLGASVEWHLNAKIEAEEEIEVLGKKYWTTRFSNHHKSGGFDFRSTYWITGGDGPGVVKQISEQAGMTFTITLKEYKHGR